MSLPSIPQIQLRVQASYQTLEFWWAPPANINGTLQSYNLLCSPVNGFPTSTITYDYGSEVSYARITNLTNHRDYHFALAASNENGQGPYAQFIVAQPGISPGGPTNVRASTFNNNLSTATIYWNFSENADEANNKYFVLNAIPSSSSASVSSFKIGLYPDQRNITIGNLSTMFYTFLVQSINDAGYSPPNPSTLIYVGPDRHFYPPNMSTLAMWLDATPTDGSTGPSSTNTRSTIGGVTGTLTGSWYDNLTANSYNSIGGPGALWAYDNVYNQYGLFFGDGQANYRVYSNVYHQFSTNSADFTIFTVHRFSTNTSGPNYLYEMFNVNPTDIAVYQNAGTLYIKNGTSTITNTDFPNSWNGIGCYISRTDPITSTQTLSYYTNGTLITNSSGTNPLNISQPVMNVGSNINIASDSLNNPGKSFNGWLFEIIMYKIALTARDRKVIEGYLAWRYWNSALNNPLPGDHPYKSQYPYYYSPMEQTLTPFSNVRITNVTNSGFTVNWSGALGSDGSPPDSVYYLVNGVQVTPSTDNGLSGQNATFTGLSSGTTYSLIIIATDDRNTVYSGVSFSPSQYSLLENWYDAADPRNGLPVSVNTTVYTWNDKSGNNNNATLTTGNISFNQGSGGNGNQTITLLNDGRNYMWFNNAYYAINQMTWMYNSGYTIFCVGDTNGQSSGNGTFLGNSSGTFMCLGFYGGPTISVNTTGVNNGFNSFNPSNNLLPVDNTSILLVYSFNPNTQFLYLNGSTGNGGGINAVAQSNTSGSLNNAAFNTIGLTSANGFGAGNYKFREIIAYKSQLSSSDQQQVEGYLAWKWGMQNTDVAGNLFGAQTYLYLQGDFTDRGLNPQSIISNSTSGFQYNIAGRNAIYLTGGNQISYPLIYSPKMTISFWFYLTSDNGYMFTTADTSTGIQTNGHANGLLFTANNSYFNGQINSSVSNTGGSGAWNSVSNFKNTWHHVAWSLDQTTGTYKIYGDGALVNTQTGTGGLQCMNYLVFGSQAGNNSASFYIQNLAVHNTAFTAGQITQLYNSTQNALPANHPSFSAPPYATAKVTTTPFTLTASAYTSSGFTISWTAPTGVTSYNYKINGATVTPTTDNGISGQNVIFTGLTINTPYSVVVTALIGTANTIVSNALSVTISPPTAITNVVASNINTSGFQVNWSGATGATSYLYELNGVNVTGTSQVQSDQGVASKYVVFQNLQANNTYNVVITAVTSGGSVTSGTYFSPSSIGSSNLILRSWYDGTDPVPGTIVNTGSTVPTWYDKSVYKNNAIAITGSVLLQNDGANFLNFYTNSGAYQFNVTSWMYNQPFVMFVVGTTVNPGNNAIHQGSGGNGFLIGYGSGGGSNTNCSLQYAGTSNNPAYIDYGIFVAGGNSSFNAIWTYNVPNIWTCVMNGGYTSTYQSGVLSQAATNQNNYLQAGAACYLGTSNYGSGNGVLNGTMREVIIYQGTLTTQQQQDVEGYLAWKYNSHTPYSLYGPQQSFLFQQDSTNRGSIPISITTNSLSYTSYQGKTALYFNSGSTYIVIPFASYIPGPFTICYWANVTVGGTNCVWALNQNSNPTSVGATSMLFTTQSNTNFGLQGQSVGSLTFPLGSSIQTINQWYHYAFAVNVSTNTLNFYMNGVLTAYQTGTMGAMTSANASYLVFGANNYTQFGGYLQNLQIYNSVLTQSQIINICNATGQALPQSHSRFSAPPGSSYLVTTTSGLQPNSLANTLTSTTITITWSGGTGAVAYIYYLNGVVTTNVTDNGVLGNTATYTGLTPNTTYLVTLTAVNQYGAQQACATSLSATTTMLPITNMTRSATSSTGFTLTWQGATGATSYAYIVNGTTVTSSTSPISVTDNGVASKTAIFTGMSGATKYQINVIASNSSGSVGYGTSSGVVVWYDGSDPSWPAAVPSDQATVAVFKDKSGQGYNSTSTTGTPKYTSSNQSIYFNGSSYYVIPERIPDNNNPITIFIVGIFSYKGNYNPLIQFGSNGSGGTIEYGGQPQGSLTNTSLYTGSYGAASVTASTSIANGTRFLTTSTSAGGISLYANGSIVASTTNTYSSRVGYTNKIGKADSETPLIGYISELIVFNASLLSTDRQRIEGYLAWKWGLQTSLPSSHPFYSASPGIVGPLFTGTTS